MVHEEPTKRDKQLPSLMRQLWLMRKPLIHIATVAKLTGQCCAT